MLDKYIVEKDNRKYLYLKFNDKEALDNMKNGNIWFRSIRFFWYYPDESTGDENDEKVCSTTTNKYEHDSVTRVTMKLNFTDKSYDDFAVFCLYKLEINDDGTFAYIDKKMINYYKYFSIVDYNEMISLLRKENLLTEMNAFYGEDYNSSDNNFYKDARYSFQKELRVKIKHQFLIEENVRQKIEEYDNIYFKIDNAYRKKKMGVFDNLECKKKILKQELFNIFNTERYVKKIYLKCDCFTSLIESVKLSGINNKMALENLFK